MAITFNSIPTCVQGACISLLGEVADLRSAHAVNRTFKRVTEGRIKESICQRFCEQECDTGSHPWDRATMRAIVRDLPLVTGLTRRIPAKSGYNVAISPTRVAAMKQKKTLGSLVLVDHFDMPRQSATSWNLSSPAIVAFIKNNSHLAVNQADGEALSEENYNYLQRKLVGYVIGPYFLASIIQDKNEYQVEVGSAMINFEQKMPYIRNLLQGRACGAPLDFNGAQFTQAIGRWLFCLPSPVIALAKPHARLVLPEPVPAEPEEAE